jgi:hypothetical protein
MLYAELACPFCQQNVASGIGFRVGAIKNRKYRIGDKLDWTGDTCRPAQKPADGNMSTIGYFNCDNVECSTWKDCFPDVQEAMIVISDNQIVEVKPAPGNNYQEYEVIVQ